MNFCERLKPLSLSLCAQATAYLGTSEKEAETPSPTEKANKTLVEKDALVFSNRSEGAQAESVTAAFQKWQHTRPCHKHDSHKVGRGEILRSLPSVFMTLGAIEHAKARALLLHYAGEDA